MIDRFRASQRRKNAVFFSFLTTAILSLTLATADAKATRPLLRLTPAIKVTKAEFARPLTEVMTSKLTGIDFEEKSAKANLMKQAREYVELRKGSLSKDAHARWLVKCETAKSENPYCAYEQERVNAGGLSKSNSDSRSDRREIGSLLKAGEFSKIASYDYPDVVGALGSIGDAQNALTIAKKVTESRSCVPSSVTTALGYKLEELFPDKEMVELVGDLYARSIDCNKDKVSALPSGTAAFRAGLISVWKGDCKKADTMMKQVGQTPEVAQLHSRAKYWRYYCAGKQENAEALKTTKAELLKDYPLSFQNLAVNGDDQIAMSNVMTELMPDVTMRSVVRPELNGIIRGAEALSAVGSDHIAAEMIDRNVNSLGETEPEVRLYVAAFLNRIGYALPKFKILANLFQTAPRSVSKASMQMMFPLWYFDLVRAKQDQVDPLLILSLIRQESAFNPQARSIVGARGLMQVMPATARSIASVRSSKLFDPSTNVGVGTKYFLKRLAQYNGDVELTLAAYNAGFARVDQWVKRYPTDNKVLFMDFIPFRETREYVTSILRNYYFYVRLYSQQNSPRETGALQSESVKVQAIMTGNAGSIASRSLDAEKH
jgi:soluble lytic murein transglycosylase